MGERKGEFGSVLKNETVLTIRVLFLKINQYSQPANIYTEKYHFFAARSLFFAFAID